MVCPRDWRNLIVLGDNGFFLCYIYQGGNTIFFEVAVDGTLAIVDGLRWGGSTTMDGPKIIIGNIHGVLFFLFFPCITSTYMLVRLIPINITLYWLTQTT